MIIVIEGCDGSGKTTMAKAMEKQFRSEGFKVVYHHASIRRWCLRHHLAKLRYALRDYASHSSNTIHIFDRLWPSEAIYGSIYRNRTYDPLVMWSIDFFLSQLGAVYVWCYDSPDALVDRHAELKQTRVEDFDDIREVAETYSALVTGAPISDKFGYLSALSYQGFSNLPNHFIHSFGEPYGVLFRKILAYRFSQMSREFPSSSIRIIWESTNMDFNETSNHNTDGG